MNMEKKEYKILDKGFVRVVEMMGNDNSIVQAARVSYGEGTKHTSQDRALIRYLMRHKHTSPFEMCEIKLHLKMPMVIGEQWLRHRTASINKYSGRYSIMQDEFYIPNLKDIAAQSSSNKQGREDVFDEESAKKIQEIYVQNSQNCYQEYEKLLEKGAARELARMVLPANIYTQFYWKCNLHNLMHFMALRSHPTSQYEIRMYSQCLEEIVKEWVPMCYEAFIDYKKEAVNVSKHMKQFLKKIVLNEQELENLGKTEILEFEKEWS